MVVIGIDIGGTKCAVVIGEYSGTLPTIIARFEFETKRYSAKELIDEFIAKIDEWFKDYSIEAIGISCGGPLDIKEGIILSPPNLPGWDRIEIVEILRKRYRIPVMLKNDADASALAEWRFGAGFGCENVVFLTFGTGLGAGLILNGMLYEGSTFAAGEIGHIRLAADGPIGYGKRGSAEGFCSGGGLRQQGIGAVRKAVDAGEHPRLLCEAGTEDNIDAKLMATLAREGDVLCRDIFNDCAENLGKIVSVLIDLLNPQTVIIGGIYPRCRDLLENGLKATVELETLEGNRQSCRILPAALGEGIGDYAALAAALEKKTEV